MKQTEKAKKPLKAIYSKAIMLGVAVILLLAALVYFTTAWYTKMVSVAGMEFQAAQWDFTANHSVSDMSVNVFEYASLNKDRAAPGSAGWIPVTISASQADTDVQYTVTVNRDTMSDEFRDRIFFYYLKNADGSKTDDNNKIYFGASPTNPSSTETVLMEGRLARGATKEIKIYWEWIYEAPSSVTDQTLRDEWDEFDTRVGEDPELYISDMNATITIMGVQIEPGTSTN